MVPYTLERISDLEDRAEREAELGSVERVKRIFHWLYRKVFQEYESELEILRELKTQIHKNSPVKHFSILKKQRRHIRDIKPSQEICLL